MTQTFFRRPQASATPTTRVGASIPRRGAGPGALGLAALLLAAACNSTDSPEPIVDGVGGYVTNSSGGNYFVDENIGGIANEFRIARQFYGRLVTIVSQAPDPAPGIRGERREIHRDFVVDPRAESGWNPEDYILETNPVTGEQTLVILADFTDLTGTSLLPGDTDASGRAKFLRLLRGADGGRIVTDSGFTGTGTFTMVPRNAAIVFVFDDLIDSETVTSAAVRFLEGTDGTTPFSRSPRFFVDPNHGAAANLDGLPGSEFYSTRLIVDAAVSELESEGFTPFTPVNNRGLPPSVDGGRANIQIRFGTQLASGQSLPPLQNPSGGRLAATGNGSVDGSSAGFDVVRAFRSGGDRNVLNDPFNGYLPDESDPVVVSSLTGLITQAPVLIAGDSDLSYRIPEIRFDSILCAPDPEPGDIIAQPPFFARVTAPATTNDVTGVASNVEVELVVVPTDSFTGPEQYTVSGLGSLQYRTPLVLENADRPECFLTVTPSPTGGAGAPTTGIATDARVAVRFNEPIDPGPLEPYESVMLLRRPRPQIPTDYVPGTVDVDSSLTLVTFRPTQPLAHVFGGSETYYLWLPGGLEAPVDLAGRSVALLPRVQPSPSDIPEGVPLTIEANEPSSLTGGHVFRFSSRDEQFPFADPSNGTRILQIPQEEWDGTALRDTVTGRLRGRAVVRFQQPISPTTENPTVAAMATGTGTPLPLNPSGAITQWVWRYVDMGLTIYSENEITNRVESDDVDIDVEGLYLSPQNANPVFETYGEFEIAMSHSNAIPDEAVDPFNNLLDAGSGLSTNYTNNLVSPAETPFQTVHNRSRGLTTQPGNTTQASDGTLLMSLGLNDDLPAEQFTTFTWRDTTIRTRGGTNAGGVPEQRLVAVTANIDPRAPADTTGDLMANCDTGGARNPIYPPGEVRSIGLPMLIQVKCYPALGESTQNVFAHAVAHSSAAPAFRAFTSGGRNQSGELVSINPDIETTAMGGFDPTSSPAGETTDPLDNAVYFGAVDFVTRISRAHSVFVPAHDPTQQLDTTFDDINGDDRFNVPEFLEPTPFPIDQPAGSDVVFEFRGARALDGDGNELIASTNTFFTDPYGDFYTDIPFELELTNQTLIDTFGTTYPVELGNLGAASCFDGSFAYSVNGGSIPLFIMNGVGENPNIDFLNGNSNWTQDPSTLTGANWIQTRVTFIANIATGRVPELSSLALNWREQ